jgi:hypothetical protein
VPTPYGLPVIKLLFATARTCAYPGCTAPLVFLAEDRGVREVAVQIAHIRSPKPDGPRYDPAFPPDQLNTDANLLLLCGVHHHPVDRNGSKYTTDELLQWKRAQTAEGGGFTVRDDEIADLAARLESSLDELVQATRLHMHVRLVGGRVGWPMPPQVVRIDLDVFGEFGRRADEKGLFRPGRLVGVEIENRGPVGAEVDAAGIDIDLGPDRREPWQYAFPANTYTPWQFPSRVDAHSARRWFDDEHSIRNFADWLFREHGSAPKRFRAWARLGNGERHNGEWISRADLPIWEPGVGEEHLRARFGESA